MHTDAAIHIGNGTLNLSDNSVSNDGFSVMIIVYPMSTAIDIMHRHDINVHVTLCVIMHPAYARIDQIVKYFSISDDIIPQNAKIVVR